MNIFSYFTCINNAQSLLMNASITWESNKIYITNMITGLSSDIIILLLESMLQ